MAATTETITSKDLALLQQQIDLHKAAHDREHLLIEEAREGTRIEMERRLDSMNALRAQTDRVEKEGVKRDEWAKAHETLTDSLNQKYDHLVAQMAVQAKNNEERFRSIEHYVWMGVGAAALIGALLHWIKV